MDECGSVGEEGVEVGTPPAALFTVAMQLAALRWSGIGGAREDPLPLKRGNNRLKRVDDAGVTFSTIGGSQLLFQIDCMILTYGIVML